MSSRRSITRRARWLVVAVGAAMGLAPASALADSIVYVKGGDIWRSAPDGSGAQGLTSGGDFVSPSQADDGTIVAVDQRSGESCRRQIVRLSSGGKVLTRLNVLGPSGPGMSALGPWYPQVSPDGTRIAFGESLIDSDLWSVICLGYGSIQQEHVTVVNAQTGKRIGMVTPPGLSNLWTPSWLPDGRVLAHAPYNNLAFQVGYGNPGEELTPWFSDPKEDPNELLSRRNISDGEVSPDGSQIAYIRGDNTTDPREPPTIEVASVASLATAPAVRCDIAVGQPPAENPSWSPNGASLAWSEQDGIHVTPIAAGTGECGTSPRLVVPDGWHPDWGPYTGSAASGFRVQVAKAVKRTALLRAGISVRVTCTTACRIDAKLAMSGPRSTVIGRGASQLRNGGTLTLRIRLTKAGRAQVKRGVKLQLRVRAQPGGTSTSTIQVR